MKSRKEFHFLLLLICMITMLVLTGCGEKKSGSTIAEPEITTDYLSEEYAQQLMTDGAETIQGFVTIKKADDSYTVHIIEKEFVPSDAYDEGYYLADTNVEKDVPLGFDARIVCTDDGDPVLSNADDFIENHPHGADEVYTVYLMGESAELIMPADPASVINE